MSLKNFKNQGFTLIELLIVMGILGILASATIPIHSNLQIKSQLSETSSQIVQTLRLAREYSRAGFNNHTYGVYFEINDGALDKYTLYQGDSFALRDMSFDKVYIVDKTLSLTTSLVDQEVNFSKSIGEPSGVGSVFLSSEDGQNHEISLNQYGFINIE